LRGRTHQGEPGCEPSIAPLAAAGAVVIAATLAACASGPEPSVDAGRQLYLESGCASCHGTEGHGDGSVAASLITAPRDFRDPDAFTRGADVASIAETIAKGVIVPSKNHWPAEEHPNQVMPQFGHLSPSERRAIALYVISLRERPGAGGPQAR
jgi:mono/diheme cytochrome c family protein